MCSVSLEGELGWNEARRDSVVFDEGASFVRQLEAARCKLEL